MSIAGVVLRRVGNIVVIYGPLDETYTHALWATHIYTNTSTVWTTGGVEYNRLDNEETHTSPPPP
jgi:hypothetical protein